MRVSDKIRDDLRVSEWDGVRPVRHALINNLAPWQKRGPTTPPAPILSWLARQLSADELRHLYNDRGLSLRHIAGGLHTNRTCLARLASEYGLTLRPAMCAPRQQIDRDWLYTEYVLHRRTLPELAAEQHMGTMKMRARTTSRWSTTP